MRTVVVALWLLLADFAAAVIVKPLSIEELAAQAQLIVRGTVQSKSCQRDAIGRVYTKVEVDISEVWKGDLKPGRLSLVHGGGILGEERVVVSGQVEYRLAEEVIVFLIRNNRGEAVTLAMAQGKFTVSRDSRGNQYVFNGVHGGDSHPSGLAQEQLSLFAFKARVTGAKL